MLARAQSGDEAAFETLWRDVNPALAGYLRTVVVGDLAQDVAADTWLTVIPRLATFRGDEKAWRAWLFATARRRAVDNFRTAGRIPTPAGHGPALFDAGADVVAESAAYLAEVEAGTRDVLARIRTLPAHQAEAVFLRTIAGLATADVARIVGRSPASVRVALHRGLRTLARHFAQPLDEVVTTGERNARQRWNGQVPR